MMVTRHLALLTAFVTAAVLYWAILVAVVVAAPETHLISACVAAFVWLSV